MSEKRIATNRKGKSEEDNREVGYSAMVLQVCIGNVQDYRRNLRKWKHNSEILGCSDGYIEGKLIENLKFFINGNYTTLMGALLPLYQKRDRGDYIFYKLYKEWREVQKEMGEQYILETPKIFYKYLEENYG